MRGMAAAKMSVMIVCEERRCEQRGVNKEGVNTYNVNRDIVVELMRHGTTEW